MMDTANRSRSLRGRFLDTCISLFGVGADLITAIGNIGASPMPSFPYSAMRGTIGELAREQPHQVDQVDALIEQYATAGDLSLGTPVALVESDDF